MSILLGDLQALLPDRVLPPRVPLVRPRSPDDDGPAPSAAGQSATAPVVDLLWGRSAALARERADLQAVPSVAGQTLRGGPSTGRENGHRRARHG